MRLTPPELLSRLNQILKHVEAELAALPENDLPSARQAAAIERWLQLSIEI